MNLAYIITGKTGEWDDTRKWNVGTCLDEAQANAKVAELNGVAASFGVMTPNGGFSISVTISQKQVAREALAQPAM